MRSSRLESLTRIGIATLFAASTAACAGRIPTARPFPPGSPLPLLDGGVHLGNGVATGQASVGDAVAARVCSLVSLQEGANAYIQVLNVRHTETLSNQIVVNGKGYPLPITLERDPYGRSPNAMAASPTHFVHLDAGPSEICLVAGLKTDGDIDDFEVEQVMLYVDGMATDRISVRRGLMMGTPPPTFTPSRPWGARQ